MFAFKYCLKFIIAVNIITSLTLTSGCIKVYKKDIHQGNYITQDALAQLKPGMSKTQVQSIMGSPNLVPIFNLSRWDYYSYFKPGNNNPIEEKNLSLYFEHDKLDHYSGDWHLGHLPRRN